MRTLEETVNQVISVNRQRGLRPHVPRRSAWPIAPVLFSRGAGHPAQPVVWQARLVNHKLYHGFKCCTDWINVLWFYEWEGIGNAIRTGPFMMPKMQSVDLGQHFPCYQEVEGAFATKQAGTGVIDLDGLTGMWAINTAEFTYDWRLKRESLTTKQPVCPRNDPSCVVLMSLGFWKDPGRCVFDMNDPTPELLEERTDRWVFFFHQYKVRLAAGC